MSNLKNQISSLLGSSARRPSGTDRLLSAGTSANPYQSLDQLISTPAGAVEQLQAAAQTQAASIAASPTVSRSSGTANAGNAFTDVAESVLGGLTLTPIVRGLM